MTEKKNLLIIFTRNPRYGKVKKRLAADIGNQSALDLYRSLLEHTSEVTRNLAVEKVVYYSEATEENDCWDGAIFRKKVQQGQDLGERMNNAFEEGFNSGYRNIIIIGSDLYDLSENDLRKAFDAMEDHDAVIGPAVDGGYYLLGMKFVNSTVFKNKSWGTSTVFQETLRDLKKKKIKMLEYRNDIDHLKDLLAHPELQHYAKSK